MERGFKWREVKGRGVAREEEIILQALDMAVPDREGTYVAAPISTGRRYYEALARSHASNFDELVAEIGIDAYLESVRWPNVADGERFAKGLRDRGVRNVIYTGPLLVDGWRGRDYMDLCFKLIVRKAQAVYFHPEWAYSSGAIKEFLFCTSRGLPCLRADGQPLTLYDAKIALQTVCKQLRTLSISCASFEANVRKLDTLTHAGKWPNVAERPHSPDAAFE